MASVRLKARGVALQALYEADTAHHAAQASVDRLLPESRLSQEAQEYARGLVLGVVRHLQEIDRILQEAAPLWPLDQVAVIDRNVIRLAIYEILFNNRERPTPVGAVINEAVELAKRFGSENSPRFVNGVLGKVSTLLPGTLSQRPHKS